MSGLVIAEAALGANVRRTILIGSGAAMGHRPVDETSVAEEAVGNPTALYGISKLALEQVVRRLRSLRGADLIVARIAQPFGPMERVTADRQAISPVGEWMDAAQSGRPLIVTNAEAAREWIYIVDLCAAFRALVDAPQLQHGLYNLGSGQLTPVRQVIAAIQSAWPDANILLDPQAPPNRNLRSEALGRVLDTRRLRAELHFAPRYSLEQAIAETAAQMRSSVFHSC